MARLINFIDLHSQATALFSLPLLLSSGMVASALLPSSPACLG